MSLIGFESSRKMKIVSWNVNGIRASLKKGLGDFIQRERPDILCLQETKAHPDQVPSPDQIPLKGQRSSPLNQQENQQENQQGQKQGQKQEQGQQLQGQKPKIRQEIKQEPLQKKNHFYPFEYWSICGKKKGYSGTAIFSQKEALKVSNGLGIKKFDHEGRVLIFELESFILLNIYFPNGALNLKRHLFKQEFLTRLKDFLPELKSKRQKELMIVGDYNTAYLDIDVHSPSRLSETSGFLPEERQWFRDFLKQGYVDVYRQFYPDKKSVYTWWSMREKARENNRGWRIDHICVTPALLSKVQSVEILSQQGGSDHCPILVEGDF